MAEQYMILTSKVNAASYKNNIALYKFLSQKKLASSDFFFLQSTSKDDNFVLALEYLSSFSNPSITDFQSWYKSCQNAITTLLKVTSYDIRSRFEPNLFALALSVRTFCNIEEEIIINPEFFLNIMQNARRTIELTNEYYWAMYVVSSKILETLQDRKEFNVSLFIESMSILSDVKEKYEKTFINVPDMAQKWGVFPCLNSKTKKLSK